MSYSTAIHELGYPTSHALKDWYKEYLENGYLRKDYISKQKYTLEQKQAAIEKMQTKTWTRWRFVPTFNDTDSDYHL